MLVRNTTRRLAILLAAFGLSGPAIAADYPVRPIKWVVPYPPGGTTDVLARRSQTLETRARQEAERTLEAAALESGLLTRADRNAARTIESLVRSLGYTDVEVQVTPRR